MARRPSQRRRIESLLDRHEKAIRDAFLAAIDNIRDNAEIGRIAEALERGDIEAALRAIHLDPAAFRAFERAIVLAYIEGGEDALATLPAIRDRAGNLVGIRFDPGNPRATAWLSRHSSNLITRIVEDQRTAIRTALSEGMTSGRNPRSVALDIVGRINRVTGRREGGIVGLTAQLERFVSGSRSELLSGDREALRNYLTRAARDRRFDSVVIRAIETGEPIPVETVNRMLGRYSDRLLELRGEVIGRTESAAAVGASRDEATRQTIEDAGIDQSLVIRKWSSTRDPRTRDAHRSMHGQEVGLNEPFIDGNGNRLMFPGDPSAPAETIINCRCVVTVAIKKQDD